MAYTLKLVFVPAGATTCTPLPRENYPIGGIAQTLHKQ